MRRAAEAPCSSCALPPGSGWHMPLGIAERACRCACAYVVCADRLAFVQNGCFVRDGMHCSNHAPSCIIRHTLRILMPAAMAAQGATPLEGHHHGYANHCRHHHKRWHNPSTCHTPQEPTQPQPAPPPPCEPHTTTPPPPPLTPSHSKPSHQRQRQRTLAGGWGSTSCRSGAACWRCALLSAGWHVRGC